MEPAPHNPASNRSAVAVWADPAEDRELLRTAARLSVDLNLPLAEPGTGPWEGLLVATPTRLELRWEPPELPEKSKPSGGSKKKKPLRADKAEKKRRAGAVFVDLESADTTSPAGRRLSQPIARAVGLKSRSAPGPVVIDATAGWGGDAWLLASLGCQVLMVERDRVVATLLRDGLLRAAANRPEMLQRLFLVRSDAYHLLRRSQRRGDAAGEGEDLPPTMAAFLQPDVVYLDPMFPATGRTAAERKPMRLLRWLVGDDGDQLGLFEMAMRVARKRVVVKRPLHAPPLGGEPTGTHEGKAARYDVYAITGAGESPAVSGRR